jgi:hypothetical protein
VSHGVAGPAPQISRRPAIGSAAGQRARHHKLDPDVRRRVEPAIARTAAARGHLGSGRVRSEYARRPTRRASALRNAIEEHLLQISVVSLLVGSVGWGLLLYNEYRSPFSAAPAPVTAYAPTNAGNADFGKAELFATSTYAPAPISHARPPAVAGASVTAGGESAASIVARDWNLFQPARVADQVPAPAKAATIAPPVRVAAPAKAATVAPPVRVVAVAGATPQLAALHPASDAVTPRVPVNIAAKTSLVDFETAPFPYHGNMPGSDRPFLNAGEEGHRGHINFHGHVFWESETYNDDRVLLHIPPGFDPKRPAVMVVFFHGHGADLERDVRNRQRLPEQITAAGANAVLVAPQFAFDAADSSAGKFWEPDGFRRFLDEAAQKLAKMYGDPRITATFVNMPIVIVAYSGGFGPTLAVLDHGGVGSRVRGLVLLDALYDGIDTFADWIANNRSAFFVSAYTPYTEHHNADLEHRLSERSVPYGSELRSNHLQGMVTFLPAGDVSHRDFVTHAWADNPVTDILARMDDVDPKIETAEIAVSKRN